MFYNLLQMLKDSPTPVRWSSLEKRSMHHWKPTANRDTQNSREGKGPRLDELGTVVFSLTCINFTMSKLNIIGVIFILSSKCNLLCSAQICEAPSSTSSTAIHRLEVLGASLLLQADRWHAYWHFPHGNAWSSPSVVLDRKCVLWLGLDSWSLGSWSGTGVAL